MLEWKLPWAKWFVGGKLNLSYNCVDRHALGPRAHKTALIWEGEPGEIRRLTYAELHVEVQKFANALKSLGIQKGDRVAVYMGMTPELAIALLACARIGAVHSVIFGGFAANAIADRVNDSGCVAIITQDTSYRRGNEIKLKRTVDEAMPACPTVKHVVVYRRTGSPVNMVAGRDHWWHDLVAAGRARLPRRAHGLGGSALHPLHLRLHRQAQGPAAHHRRLRGANLPHHQVRLRPARRRHLLVHGRHRLGHRPLLCRLRAAAERRHRPDVRGRAQLPRLFALLEDRRRSSSVTIFYTAPTAIRAFIKWGDEHVEKYKLDSLRLLGTVGEPINPEAWMWYREKIGHNRCPIVDTWWQTETGAIMIAPIPGAVPTKPGSATRPFFGIQPEVVTKPDAKGHFEPVPAGSRRAACHSQALAVHGAHGLRRS